MPRTPEPESFLPLHPLEFEILLSLLDESRHGYEIVKAIEAEAGGSVYPANLYRRIRDLLGSALLEEVDAPDARADVRRRYLRITALGKRVARAEAQRMRLLLRDTRTRKLLESM
jgi:DNA-binding PadR family transcriptional regulator